MFSGATCGCCGPSSPRPCELPRELPETPGSVAITVLLLSGEPLVELSAAEHMSADELRAEVEARASARLDAECCSVRALLWRSSELEGARTLQELGVRGQQDVVAVLVPDIKGAFEERRCVPCEYSWAVHWQTLARLSFEQSGVAVLEYFCRGCTWPDACTCEGAGRYMCRYTLGGVEERDGPGRLRRSLRLEPESSERVSRPFSEPLEGDVLEGWLELDAADPVNLHMQYRYPAERRLRVEGARTGIVLELVDVDQLDAHQEIDAHLELRRLYRLEHQLDADQLGDWLQELALAAVWQEEEKLADLAEAGLLPACREAPGQEAESWHIPDDAAGETSMYRRVFCRPRRANERRLRDRCPWFLKPGASQPRKAARTRAVTRKAERAGKEEAMAA